jgi:hypothetical protein
MRETIQSIIALTAALYLTWISASVAYAFPGTFEAPFVDAVDVSQVPGSEGKIGFNGEYKVEIPTAQVAIAFDICLVTDNLGTVFLRDAVSDEDGELKVESSLGQDRPDVFGTVTGTTTTLQAPRFQVRADSAANDCTGALLFESGLDITVSAEGTPAGGQRSRRK